MPLFPAFPPPESNSQTPDRNQKLELAREGGKGGEGPQPTAGAGGLEVGQESRVLSHLSQDLGVDWTRELNF